MPSNLDLVDHMAWGIRSACALIRKRLPAQFQIVVDEELRVLESITAELAVRMTDLPPAKRPYRITPEAMAARVAKAKATRARRKLIR